MNLLRLPDPQFPPLSNRDYKHPPGQGNSELPYVGQPARRRSSINVSPITRPLRRPALEEHGGQGGGVKSQLEAAGGGSARDFYVVGPGASASLQDSANLGYLHPAFLGASGG